LKDWGGVNHQAIAQIMAEVIRTEGKTWNSKISTLSFYLE
jgi:hypothetical protein